MYTEDKLIKWTAISLWKIDSMLILKGLKFWMIPLSNLKLQHFSITGADFAESQCNVHISCDQFQLLWWTSWPPSHRFHVLSVLLSGLLTHAHALPWLIVAMPGIIKVNSPSTWRSTCAKLFTGPHRLAWVSQNNNLPAYSSHSHGRFRRKSGCV